MPTRLLAGTDGPTEDPLNVAPPPPPNSAPASDQTEALTNTVIDRLYDVALDPERLDGLLDHWEALIAPRRRDADTFGPLPGDVEGFAAHFRRLNDILDRMQKAVAQDPLRAVLAEFRKTAAFVIDSSMAIAQANEAAQTGLGIAAGQPLRQVHVHPDDLEELIREVSELFLLDRRGDDATQVRDGGDRLVRVRGLADDRLILIQPRLIHPADGAAFVLAVTSDLHWPESARHLLRATFGLTAAEIDVLKALTESRSLREIAQRRGRSIETIRAQIKSLQSKTESSGQNDLMRLALSVMEIAPMPIDHDMAQNGGAPASPHSSAHSSAHNTVHSTVHSSARPSAHPSVRSSDKTGSHPDHWPVADAGLGHAGPVAKTAQAPGRDQNPARKHGQAQSSPSHWPTTSSTDDAQGFAATPPPQMRRPKSANVNLPHPQRVSPGGTFLRPRLVDRIASPDGRVIEYLQFGAKSGSPVIYMCGTFGLCRWTPEAEHAALARNQRIIVPIRPSYGGSSPLPKGANRLDIILDDTRLILDHLGIGRAAFLTTDEDLMFAICFHHRYPQRISGIVAAAGQLPLTRPEQYERMGRWHRFILAGARYTPALVPLMVRTGFFMARKIGRREFVRRIYAGSAPDRELTLDPEIFEAMEIGSEIVFDEKTDGTAAFGADVLLTQATDWLPQLRATQGQLPIFLLHGQEDPAVPPATVAEYREDFPWIDYETIAGAGQLLLFRHIDRLLDRLAEIAETSPDATPSAATLPSRLGRPA